MTLANPCSSSKPTSQILNQIMDLITQTSYSLTDLSMVTDVIPMHFYDITKSSSISIDIDLGNALNINSKLLASQKEQLIKFL
jgi:hypothetical protein